MSPTQPPSAADEEQRRLARLRELAVLDTAPEPVFDALVRIAAAVCGTPIALISLIDTERQWFKANLGLEGVAQTPRDVAFCDHAIRGNEVMEVPDATRDARFATNPLVTGDPDIRFYAGAPIEMPGGERIGTLCVIDRRPGELDARQLAALRDLATVAQWALLQRERLHQVASAGADVLGDMELLASVVENLPCGLSVFDGELRLIAHNRQFRQMLAFPDHLFDGTPHFQDFLRFNAARGDYGPGDPEDQVQRVVEEIRAEPSQHLQRPSPDGGVLDMRRSPLPGGGFITTYVDVTQATAADKALRDSEERQKRALDASGLSLWELDLDSGWMYLSENWSLLLGGAATPTITTPLALTELVPAEQRPALTQALTAMLKGETDRYAVEHQVRRKDGSHAWIHSEGRVTRRAASGEALYATGTNQDVTARKEAELQLARSAAITRATVQAAADGIMVVDASRRVIFHNERLSQMWGAPAKLEGAVAPQLQPHVAPQMLDPAGFTRRVEQIYNSDELETFDELLLRDGRVFERHSRRIDLDGGYGRVWTFHDITAQRKADQELHAAKEAAEAANRAKTDFLDNVSHEIRTPLNGVLGLTRLLLAEPLSEQQRRYVHLADASAASLLELINDLLDLGKIEAGRMELEDAPFRLDELLQQLNELYRLRAGEKGLQFVLDVAPNVPSSVSGDAGRLRQILNNLLSNAFKFTERGEFGLIVGRPDGPLGPDVVRFTVYDTGIGIPYDVQKKLFTRFAQAERSTSRKYGGTGLGLAIVKQLSEQMGGSVLLQSEPGRGASFRCDLPLRAADEPVPNATPLPLRAAGAVRSTRILVAEDNPTNQVVVRGLLAQAGYRDVTLADDGQQAVDAAMAGDFDLVLMDCRMPVLDGYGATMQLRARGFTAPIIALTANAAAGERERCLAHGMNDYLAKPIDAGRLAQVLAEWTVSASAEELAAAPAQEPAAPANPARQAALERLGGDEELLAAALGSFREHAPKVLQAARAAFAAGNQADLHRHLHSLSGSSGMVGAEQVRALAKQLEAEAQAGRLAAAGAGLEDLAERCADFLADAADWVAPT
ncbi:PAS-domain containing protein [Ramlibacter sp. XY19]|uniref:PAS-domain containing protein n=1 Tax=Ramlibacter paludis TaxID=2908000 RepID=UPI0023DAE1F4|nr:PAS-domain containing protein [Ramlibacter paludis]MCG2595673.1 PAS-domain containing protein [Ramlibacter paludis]